MKGFSHIVVGVCAVGLTAQTTGFMAHRGVGTMAGISVTSLGLGLVVGVIGAALPDIDSPNAKIRYWLGLADDQDAWSVADRWARVPFPRRGAWRTSLAGLFFLPILLYQLVARTTLNLALEHRGPTHSLLAAGGLAFVVGFAPLPAPWPGWPGLLAAIAPGWADIGTAFVIGYLSHLAADAVTKHGVPALWPLPRDFGWLPRPFRITTGEPMEYIIVAGIVALTSLRFGALTYLFNLVG